MDNFDKWFSETYPTAYRSNPYEYRAKGAWDYQQKKIDKLGLELENYKRLELRALRSVEKLAIKNSIMREALEFYNDYTPGSERARAALRELNES